jgi:hypothetical protein
MSDTMQGGVHPFPERTQVFRRDRRMTTADEMIRNADDWRIYVREDAVQAQIDAAVRQARSDAISEFCAKAGIRPLQQVQGLPDDVRIWRMEAAVEARRDAIRKGDQP